MVASSAGGRAVGTSLDASERSSLNTVLRPVAFGSNQALTKSGASYGEGQQPACE